MDKRIDQVILYVKNELQQAESGHDWFHIERVYKNALHIVEGEGEVDLVVVKLIALLHDIADSKFHGGDETVGPNKAKRLLEELSFDSVTIEHVVKGIENISFKGGNFNQVFRSKELDIVQDADRLDAIGAIGIARTFNYGGYKNNLIYDPKIEPKIGMSKEEYKNNVGTTINHFYEKLLRLKDLMNTDTGRQLAEGRHRFMESFLSQFYDEWEGNA
ncbi:HD domain-containing protein [Myroides marinus]|uniref:HD domain-containing protein n=1 Tax=Myroides marinus TaxID=703342 RepID=UPI002575207A|nr:HD domain-containing protein [Myroides marinus]MDM1378861.1 HD domain-containing protein [Myroides marinus]MDM1386132.1 HD domain-containing protein [Myroides marinus]MDM1393345.1 HD domain-containing protein [Myroides marinus]MDM1402535.1 HD domain-containing protein [Myroides marinus]